ncbi:MAG: methyl-accepting chemotaxis sensory transducer [Verrucomicrobiaceae bacterium]|nr:methyl-accepting chemotaxis sensory transducer [Verrucomicrobiaceae bacterium]
MKWSVGAKIGSGFALALVILLAIGVSSYQNTSSMIDAAAWRTHTYAVIADLEHLLSIIKDGETGQRGYIITGQSEYLGPYKDAVSTVRPALDELVTLTHDNVSQQRQLERLKPLIQTRFAQFKSIIELRDAKGFDVAVASVQLGEGKKVMDEIREIIAEMRVEEQRLLKIREQRADEDTHRAIAVIIYGIPVAFVLLAILATLITRNIAEPLRELAAGAVKIAEGDLTINLKANAERADEVGALVRAFVNMIDGLQHMAAVAGRIAAGDIRDKVQPRSPRDVLGNAFAIMLDKLRAMTSEINSGVNVLVSAAAEILAATTQMAAGSAETATAVSQTASTVEEVKQTAVLASNKAQRVADNAQTAVAISQDGSQAVQASIEAMRRIQEQMESIAESIVRLSEQGHAIGEIIATVNDLAEQSNLLAVNATIEAAKAGEQGKGFAVVAQEVKSLAAQSKQATAQVRGILGEIQKATSAAVTTTERGSREVETGDQLSVKLDEVIHGLTDSISEAARAATQIAASSQQQLVGMDQVALAMQNIREASTQNVASNKQTESAAQNLHQVGLRLKQLVEQYQV